jgi:hypothetical protein
VLRLTPKVRQTAALLAPDATGGSIEQLNTSFRSLGTLCEWINGAFEPLFDEFDPHYQAEFAPLLKFKPDGQDDYCVRQIRTDKANFGFDWTNAATRARSPVKAAVKMSLISFTPIYFVFAFDSKFGFRQPLLCYTVDSLLTRIGLNG